MIRVEGVITALVTPFSNGKVDYESLRRLVKFQATAGVAGCVICGTTGESPTVTDIEREKIFECVREEVGNSFPVFVGTGSYSTQRAIDLTCRAQRWGADGAVVVTPYYSKPPQRGLVHHFLEISKSSDLPMILYNVPSRTGISLDPETVEVLSRQENIIGIKEASGDMGLGKEISIRCGPDFFLLSGDDNSWLDLLGQGGCGVISVLSNVIPVKMTLLYKYMTSGDEDEHKQALKEFKRYHSLLHLLSIESNPIPVKMALKLMGIIDSSELRSPLVDLSEENTEMLEKELRKLGVKS